MNQFSDIISLFSWKKRHSLVTQALHQQQKNRAIQKNISNKRKCETQKKSSNKRKCETQKNPQQKEMAATTTSWIIGSMLCEVVDS